MGKKKNKWPESYMPESLRAAAPSAGRRKEMFAVGFQQPGGHEYGMKYGPFPTLKEALDVVPEHDGQATTESAVIIHYNKDGTNEPIYLWVDDLWIRMKPDGKKKKGRK